jgi:methyltransferase (TIGR00027 family)
MRSGKPSRTAQFVAYNRALGTLAPQVPGFSDPIAAELLPDNWKKKIERTRRSLAANPGNSPYPFWMRGMGLFNQFRSVVLDRAIAEAAPIAQLVILGAGFDTRAWRLQALDDATVFEVDHPATQALKRARVAAIPAKAREVRYVATDFHSDDMAASLCAAGYDARRPAFLLWEGVTMYLRPDAVAANLAALAALSAPGSRLALTYLSKDGERIPRSLFLALLGEPVRSAYTPAEITDLAGKCGWAATADSGIEDWLRDLTPGLRLTRRQAGLQWFERIWVARLLLD